jgi:hypothetical protein
MLCLHFLLKVKKKVYIVFFKKVLENIKKINILFFTLELEKKIATKKAVD